MAEELGFDPRKEDLLKGSLFCLKKYDKRDKNGLSISGYVTVLLREFADQLSQQKSIADLKGCFKEQITALGYVAFDAFSYQVHTVKNLRQDGNFYVASYGLEYIEQFVDQGMIEACPIMRRLSQSSFPFDYIEALEAHKSNWVVKFQYGLMKFFNIHHAWLIPFNTIDQVKGVTLYTQGRGKEIYEQFLNSQSQAQVLAGQFLQALEALDPSKTMLETLSQKSWNKLILSARETECLHYCCQGLTYKEIGAQLEVSENTIRFHMKNIFRKLDVTSRSEAVAVSRSIHR